MSFISKNPLSMPEIEHIPSTPSGTKGLFAKEDGWYEISDDGTIKKILSEGDLNVQEVNSIKYYGDASIVASDESLFAFTVDDETMTASVKHASTAISGNIVIPYKCVVNDKIYIVTSLVSFYNCKNLESIIIPNSINELPQSAFYNCVLLKNIKIPESVKSIGKYALSYCKNLTNIIIPHNVKNIKLEAFYNCDSLTDVYYEGSKEQWNMISIGAGNEALLNATIHYAWSERVVVDEILDALSRNPVQNQAIVAYFQRMEEADSEIRDYMHNILDNRIYDLEGWKEATIDQLNYYIGLISNNEQSISNLQKNIEDLSSAYSTDKAALQESILTNTADIRALETQLGDIEAALDAVLVIQNSLIGGDGV